MLRLLLLALLLGSRLAVANITVLAGSSPQTTAVGSPFPNPVRVLVTDAGGAAQAGAAVRYSAPYNGISAPAGASCPADAFYISCDLRADASGVVTLQLAGTNTGDYRATFYYGSASANVELHVVPAAGAFAVEFVGGGAQRVALGHGFAPVSARITREGRPVTGIAVSFASVGQPQATFDPSFAIPTTNADGIATSTRFVVKRGLGTGTIKAVAVDRDVHSDVVATTTFASTNDSGETFNRVAPLWWGGPSQNGWGVSISQHEERLFPMFFIYDETGHPTWHLLDAGSWTFGVATYYQGALISPRSSPFYAYDPGRFVAGSASGFGFLDFEPGTPVNLMLDVAFPQLAPRVVSIEPFQLPSGGRPDRGVSDIWWGGPAQSGWGVSITEQHGSLFLVWFTYDDAGRATWYAMTEGSWIGDATWSGPIERTSGAPVGTAADYDPSRFRAERVGNFSVRFVDSNHAMMEYELEGRRGALALERFDF